MTQLMYALVVVPLLIVIGIAVVGMFFTNINRSGWSTAANSTFSTVEAQTWSGYNLGALLPFIIIALTIVAVVLGALGLRRAGGFG